MAGRSATGSGFLQNPIAVFGVSFAGTLLVIGLALMLYNGTQPPPPVDDTVTPRPPAGSSPDISGGPATPQPSPGYSSSPVVAPPPTTGSAPTTSSAGRGQKPQHRGNPFAPNKELRHVMTTLPPDVEPPTTPDPMAPGHGGLMEEANQPDPTLVRRIGSGDSARWEPPLPPMRVSGIVIGSRSNAMLQMGDDFFQITPGQRVPPDNPVFRVENIRRDGVLLSRRWERQGHRGIQRVEVRLAGARRG